MGDSGGNGWSKGVGDSDGCGLVGREGKGAGSTKALAMAVATAAARVAGAGADDSGGDGCSKGGQYPRDVRGLRCPCAPARGQRRWQQVCQCWRQGGGRGGGQGTGGGMIIDPRSVPAAICQGRVVLQRGMGGNGTNYILSD